MLKIPDGLKVAVLMFVGIVLSFKFNPIFVFGAVVAASIAFRLLGEPFALLVFLIWWAMTSFVYSSIFHTKLLDRVDDILVLLMLGVYLGRIALRRIHSVPFVRYYLVLLGFCAFSFAVNRSPIFNMGLFLLAYCAPFLIFCLVFAVNSPKVNDRMIQLVLLVFLFGVALNVGWFFHINPIYNYHLGTVDFAKGTIGDSAGVAYFSIFIIFLLVSMIRQNQVRKKRVQYGLLLVLAFVQFYLCYANHAYLYMAAVFPAYLMIIRARLSTYFLLGGAAVLLLLLLKIVGSHTHLTEQSGVRGFVLMDPEMLAFRWKMFLQQPKVMLFERVVTHGLDHGVLQWFVGHGPGAGVGTVARTRATPYTFEMLGDIYLTFSGQESMVGHSITQHPWSGITTLWSEVGMIGTILFFVFPLLPGRIVFQRVKQGYYPGGSSQLVIAEAFLLYLCLFYVMNILNGYWSDDPYIFLLWLLAGLALKAPGKPDEAEPDPVPQPEDVPVAIAPDMPRIRPAMRRLQLRH